MQNLEQFLDYVYRYPNVQTCEQTLKVLQVRIESIEQNEINFDIIGLKPALVNTIRQTILNEIPTMAIEDVYFHKNTSLFNCDYISQRLALIPIKVDPNYFKFVAKKKSDDETTNNLNSDNCIVLNLNVKNTKPDIIKVYSKDLIWEPIGSRQHLLPKIEPLFPNIPILCLKNDQEISCRLHCIKGKGIDHMKFSPGFARYYFHSKITLINVENILPDTAMRIASSFPPGVIQIRFNPNGNIIPIVSAERLDHQTRSFKNYEDVSNHVQVKYYRDHLIFAVESYGVLDPIDMVISALNILIYKYETWKLHIQNHAKKYQEEIQKAKENNLLNPNPSN